MAMDNRDWYRDLWRKKTGYVERSDFRSPVHQPPSSEPPIQLKPPPTPYPYGRIQRQKNEHRRAWRHNFIKLALLLLVVFVTIALFKHFRA